MRPRRADILERAQKLLQVLVWGGCQTLTREHKSGKAQPSAEWPCQLPKLSGAGHQVLFQLLFPKQIVLGTGGVCVLSQFPSS